MKTSGILASIAGTVLLFAACSKDDEHEGQCYCHYYGGNQVYHDFTMLSDAQAQDSCAVLDGLASGYAGDCEMK